MQLFVLSALASVATAQRWAGIGTAASVKPPSVKPQSILYSPAVRPVGIGYTPRPVSVVAAMPPAPVLVSPELPVAARAVVPGYRSAVGYGGIPPPAYGLPVKFKGDDKGSDGADSDKPVRKRADGAEPKITNPIRDNLEFQRKATLQVLSSDALDEDLSARSVSLLREIQTAAGLPKIDKSLSNVFFLQSYNDAAEVSEEALQFYLDSTPADKIDREKLQKLQAKADAANFKRLSEVSRIAGNSELGQALYIKHRQLGSEIAEQDFLKKLEDYRAGKKGVTVESVEMAEKAWRSKKAAETADVMGYISKFAGGLGPLESLLHYPALQGEQEATDIAENALFHAEEEFAKDPSQKNRDNLILAELTFEAAELKEKARTARLLGNNLLYNLLYTKAVAVAQEAMDLKERQIASDYSKAVAEGRFNIDDYYEYEEDTLAGYRVGGYRPDAAVRFTGRGRFF